MFFVRKINTTWTSEGRHQFLEHSNTLIEMDDGFHVGPSLMDECVADARAAISQVLPRNAISDEELYAPTFEVDFT